MRSVEKRSLFKMRKKLINTSGRIKVQDKSSQLQNFSNNASLGSVLFVFNHSAMSTQLFATTRTVTHQAPLSMGFPRQEYSSGLPFPFAGDLPNPGIELTSPALAGRFFTTEPQGSTQVLYCVL